MFRVQDNVPQVYINESRDFQLISRLYDALFQGVKFEIDSIVNVMDASTVRDDFLPLLCSRVGFFPTVDIDSITLRSIVAAFPYIIKYKGTKMGVEMAVNAVLRSEANIVGSDKPYVVVQNQATSDLGDQDNYMFYIYTKISDYNKGALDELLKYVLPIGTTYKLYPYKQIYGQDDSPMYIMQSDKASVVEIPTAKQGYIQNSTDYHQDKNIDIKLLLGGAVDSGIVSSDKENEELRPHTIYPHPEKVETLLQGINGDDK